MSKRKKPPRAGGQEAEPDPPPDGTPTAVAPELKEALRYAGLQRRLSAALVAESVRRGGNETERDEIEQDVRIRIWEKDPTLAGFDWTKLPGIVAKEWDRAVRKRNDRNPRRKERQEEIEVDTLAAHWKRCNPEVTVLELEKSERIAREINGWSEAQRAPFLLQQSGWTRPEIAEELEISLDGVNFHMTNAYAALRLVFAGDDRPTGSPGQNGNTRGAVDETH